MELVLISLGGTIMKKMVLLVLLSTTWLARGMEQREVSLLNQQIEQEYKILNELGGA